MNESNLIDENIYHVDPKRSGQQEIIGKTPSWIIFWGSSIFFILLLTILICSWFVHYPETVSVPVTFYSTGIQKVFESPTKGFVGEILVTDGQLVVKGQPILVINTNANYKALKQFIEQVNNNIESSATVDSIIKSVKLNEFNEVFSQPIAQLRSFSRRKNTAKTKHLLKIINDSFRSWSEQHILSAPFDGKVQFLSVFIKNQQIDKFQPLYCVKRLNSGFIGLAKLSQRQGNKILPGQVAEIKISGMHGVTDKKISGIILKVNTGNLNAIYCSISLNNELDNRFLQNYSTGKASILIGNRRLLELLIPLHLKK